MQLPSKYGKVHKEWLGKNRVNPTTLKSFSNIILHLVPIISLFLDKFCSEDAELATVCRCFKLLYMILGVFSAGTEVATRFKDQLESMLEEFHRLYAGACPSVKPKLHHMRHITDGMAWLGKLLSCFVTERKHRDIKASALHVFRHIEHTVLADVVNKQCQQMVGGVELFMERFLVSPHFVQGGNGLHRSRRAVLPCGEVSDKDIVWLRSAQCARVKMFYQSSDPLSPIIVDAVVMANIANDPSFLDELIVEQILVDSVEVVDACVWFYDEPAQIRVAIPPAFLLTVS